MSFVDIHQMESQSLGRLGPPTRFVGSASDIGVFTQIGFLQFQFASLVGKPTAGDWLIGQKPERQSCSFDGRHAAHIEQFFVRQPCVLGIRKRGIGADQCRILKHLHVVRLGFLIFVTNAIGHIFQNVRHTPSEHRVAETLVHLHLLDPLKRFIFKEHIERQRAVESSGDNQRSTPFHFCVPWFDGHHHGSVRLNVLDGILVAPAISESG